MVLLISLLLSLLVIISLYINRDVFSPSKFYILYLFIYFFDILINQQEKMTYIVYILFVLIGYTFVFLEKKLITNTVHTLNKNEQYINEKQILLVLWGISSIPILAQIYLMYLMGGYNEYMMKLPFRVIEWQGLGYITMLKSTFPIINIIYFIVGLVFKIRNKKAWWILFLIHFSLLVYLGVLSGSRGATLVGFVYIIVSLNYLIKRIPSVVVIVLMFSLLITASYMELLRNNFSSKHKIDLDIKLDFSKVKLATYGTDPLNVVFKNDFDNLQYGTTYATIFTNIVPRKVWPDKPPSAGVTLTKFKDGSRYSGSSHITPGFFVEGIMNYGYILGPFVGLFILYLFIILSIMIYKAHLNAIISTKKSIYTVKMVFLYLIFMEIPANMLLGEFTNTLMILFVKMIFGLIILKILSKNIIIYGNINK